MRKDINSLDNIDETNKLLTNNLTRLRIYHKKK